uniref:Complement decay-accelerating factor-like n=1 Tax=Phascolarctos cinereus TaxID=38626 RepID=A0A6P5JVX2_PHACI|nr:complement decay-accelerating factor-like [Phascolarctos cinereus]XP_020835757.1 complement decay-accelerating factor-like [Phascolarctos cinereus]
MLIESPRRQSAEESSRWGRSCLAVRGGSRVHLEPRASAMGACPRRGAWLCSVGLLGALALLPRALLALPLNLGNCNTLPAFPHAPPEENYDADKIFVVGTIVHYKCDTGYVKLMGNSDSIICQGMEWSEIPQFCDHGCFPPGPYPGMKRSAEFISRLRFPFNITVTFVCQPGYTLSKPGPLLSTCQDDGTWSPVSGSCNKVKCKTPKVDNAVQLTGFGSFHGYKDTVDFKCEDGYFFLRGNGTITCEADSNWSPVLPFCSTEHAYTEPPYPSRPGSASTSQQEPPVSSQPGPSLPPNKEPQGFGIIIVIVLTIVIVFSMISFIAYRRYKEK